MTWRQRKFIVNGTHLLLAFGVFLTVFGFFPLGRALGCVSISALSACLVVAQSHRLLRGYYDRMCRLEVYIPATAGVVLAVLAMWASPVKLVDQIALLQLLFWVGFAIRYRLHGWRFNVHGDGPLPWYTWLNVPAEQIREGDLLLMSGRISRLTRNSVGHVELVVRRNGKLVTITAYIEQGIVLWKTVRALCKVQVMQGGHYIVLRPLGRFTQEQNDRCIEFAEKAFKANRDRVATDLPRIQQCVNRILPDRFTQRRVLKRFMPGFKSWLLAKLLPTGYDSVSMRIGTHRENLWTCHWIVLKTLEAAEVAVEPHESGFLGLGTGFLNPPYPVTLMADRNFRLLSLENKIDFETKSVDVGPDGQGPRN